MTGRTVHTLDASGHVRDWLVGPTWSSPCDDLDAVLDATGSPWGVDGRWVLTNGPDVAPLKERLYARRPLVVDQELPSPVEGSSFSWRAPGGEYEGVWRRVHTGRDGLVDRSRFCYTPEYRHAVAATGLEVDQAEWRVLEVACTGPFALWAGAELVAVRDRVSYMEPLRHEVPVRLTSGVTRLVLATWQVAFRECRHIASVRVAGQPVRVVLDSPDAEEFASAVAEQVLDGVYVRSWAAPDGVVVLRGPAGAALSVARGDGPSIPVRLVDGTASLRLAELPSPAGGDATASMLSTGETTLTVGVDAPNCPVRRTLATAVLPPEHRGVPVGEPGRWRASLLDHVASAHPGVARALARGEVTATDLDHPLAMLSSRADCADFEAVGLLHLLHRIPAAEWPDGERDRTIAALLGFKYWIDQPGLDAMCYFTENHQFVWHTAELLAGSLFPSSTFTNTGWTGREHAAHGVSLAAEWMRRKLAGGFSEFDSNAYLAIDSLALVSLVELAPAVEIRRLAEALLDKVLLTLAANSWRGVHGAAHGRSYVPTLRSSRFEETAPIMWLLWGTGSLNSAVLPATALATARCYVLPPLVRAVAHADGTWSGRQVYRGDHRFTHDLLSRPYGSDLHVWRTPDAMLSSVQDYRPGLPGLQEHVWGATLGPEVQVFATLPAADTNSPSARPNAWAGQQVLPRVRQHRDTLLVRYPTGVPGRTHVWFPSPLMDHTTRRGPWLAGRVGSGYVAVATAGGLDAVGSGEEWLPMGDGLSYVATVGRTADDGSFDEFVDALRDPVFGPTTSVVCRDGRVLALAETGPFTVDGSPVGLDADGRPETPPHLDNPAVRVEAGAPLLEADWNGHRLVLDLATGRRLEPESGVPDAG